MKHMPDDMKACIKLCQECYATCLSTAMHHCLEAGGKHLEPSHFRLMLACAETCRTSAHLMLIGTDQHKHTCAACSKICNACAASCEGLDGMQECADMCRRCAAECEKMAA